MTITTLCVRPPELTHLTTGSLCPSINISPPAAPLPPALGNHHLLSESMSLALLHLLYQVRVQQQRQRCYLLGLYQISTLEHSPEVRTPTVILGLRIRQCPSPTPPLPQDLLGLSSDKMIPIKESTTHISFCRVHWETFKASQRDAMPWPATLLLERLSDRRLVEVSRIWESRRQQGWVNPQ